MYTNTGFYTDKMVSTLWRNIYQLKKKKKKLNNLKKPQHQLQHIKYWFIGSLDIDAT